MVLEAFVERRCPTSAAWPIVRSWPEFALYSSLFRSHSSRLRAYHRLCCQLVESDSGTSLDGHGVPGGGRSHEGR